MEKRVDESWKDQVEQEKKKKILHPPEPEKVSGTFSPEAVKKAPDPGAGEFALFLSTLSMQALMALGEAPHPETQTAQEDLEQARYLIDVLGMLEAKTKENLTAEESSLLEGVLYELRMKYVAKTQGAAP